MGMNVNFLYIFEEKAHLYSHDGEVWHRRVVEVDAGVRVVPHAGEDFGTDWSRAVTQHLTQRVHVNVFGSQSGTYGVIRARHTLHTVWRSQSVIHGIYEDSILHINKLPKWNIHEY